LWAPIALLPPRPTTRLTFPVADRRVLRQSPRQRGGLSIRH
jgi:hypothetical protein